MKFQPDHRNALDKDQLEHLHRVIEFLQQKEYVKAHDQYLQMAIGNAPWPIGVTMVGIHEVQRAARAVMGVLYSLGAEISKREDLQQSDCTYVALLQYLSGDQWMCSLQARRVERRDTAQIYSVGEAAHAVLPDQVPHRSVEDGGVGQQSAA